MKKIISLLALSMLVWGQAAAQHVDYFLPKTVLVVEVEAIETTEKAGPFVNYSERYLSLKDVITADKISWEISKISVKTKTVADEAKQFGLDLTDEMTVQLSSKGFLLAINTSAPKTLIKLKNADPKNEEKVSQMKDFFNSSALTEEQLQANSTAKMAENAAKQIYRIRESRINLISGENERLPADGESLKLMLQNLEKTERELLQLFAGKKMKRKVTQEFEICPTDNLKNEVICRFSTRSGIVDKSDANGSPICLNVNRISPKIAIETTNNDKKKTAAISYNIPAQAQAEVKTDEQVFAVKEVSIAQLGTTGELPLKSLQKGTQKAVFDAKTGALISVGKKK